MKTSERERRLAVIDLGSNSARLVVLAHRPGGPMEVRADARAPLRLVRQLDANGAIPPAVIDRIVSVVKDFRAVAEGTGAERIVAAATAAIREASNGREVLRQIAKATRIRVAVLSGKEEAAVAFLGAIWGLPVRSGLLLDVGGGSLQISRFRNRRLSKSWSLPLGALRMSDRFFSLDPPSEGEVRRLRRYIAGKLGEAGIPPLEEGEALVGTGGTIRNLAKIDDRSRDYPVPHLHGYSLSRRRVQSLTEILSTQRLRKKTRMPGLNADRVDSIVGGSWIVETAMEAVGAGELIVSGQGLREGIAYRLFHAEPPPVRSVREASIRTVASRFSSWDSHAAERRALLAETIQRRLDPGATQVERELLRAAATILDVGRSIDFYHRHRHTAMILRSTDLGGFSHREIAWLAAIVEFADEDEAILKRMQPLLGPSDHAPVDRASAILALADEIERRVPNGTTGRLRITVRDREVLLHIPPIASSRTRFLQNRFRRAFGRKLRLNG